MIPFFITSHGETKYLVAQKSAAQVFIFFGTFFLLFLHSGLQENNKNNCDNATQHINLVLKKSSSSFFRWEAPWERGHPTNNELRLLFNGFVWTHYLQRARRSTISEDWKHHEPFITFLYRRPVSLVGLLCLIIYLKQILLSTNGLCG